MDKGGLLLVTESSHRHPEFSLSIVMYLRNVGYRRALLNKGEYIVPSHVASRSIGALISEWSGILPPSEGVTSGHLVALGAVPRPLMVPMSF